MSFTSFYFFVFLAVFVCAYYAAPIRFRWVVLLLASAAFTCCQAQRLFVLLFTAVITFFGGRYIGEQNHRHKQYLSEHGELSREEKKS